jgi:hypothetical protein
MKRLKGKLIECRDRPVFPRAILFGNLDRALVHLSPDSAHLAWLAPNPQWRDLYRIHIVTGEMALLLPHDRFMGVIVDDGLEEAAWLAECVERWAVLEGSLSESDAPWRLRNSAKWHVVPATREPHSINTSAFTHMVCMMWKWIRRCSAPMSVS